MSIEPGTETAPEPQEGPRGVDSDLRALMERWAADDVDLDDATATLGAAHGGPQVLAAARDAFAGALSFGTAGLRGAMAPGPNRMNRAVVVRAAAGLASYLRAQLDGRQPLVVVGYDARHHSARFARDSAAVLSSAGCRAILLPAPLPTPLLAYAVRRLNTDAGVMVTASHNPKDDNGYKVYLGGRVSPGPGCGVQIIAPADADIAARIHATPPAREVPRAEDESAWEVAEAGLVERYSHDVVSLLAPGPRDLRIVTTALHGVGGRVLHDVLAQAGFSDVTAVVTQAEPDPEFPTVAFPNPEEPGALDLALALAADTAADLVIAVDPDADRCSIAVPDPDRGKARDSQGWRQLSGDEVGALLTEHTLTRTPAPTSADPDQPPTVAASLVSGSLLHRIAEHHGVASVTTLTGFKWIARVPGLVMGYEEAIGYCVAPALVRDKDGISAALLLAELAASARAEGRTLLDLLDDLHRRHGVHLTAPVTSRLQDMSVVAPVLERLLQDPPESLAGAPVTDVQNLTPGLDGLPGTPGVRLLAGTAARVVIRPSGTEPKLKAYLQVVRAVGADGLAVARQEAAAALEILRTEVTALLRPPDT